MKLIERIHRTLADLEGKNIATKRPPEQVDRVLYLFIIDLFNKYLDVYAKTKKIDNYMLPFKKQGSITLTNGIGALPEDFAHHRSVFLNGVEIDVVEDKFWNNRVNSKLSPVASKPICRIENTGVVKQIEVAPSTTVGPLTINYFKYPTAPRYAYTPNGSRYDYDEVNSIDVELPEGLLPDIIVRLTQAFGISARDAQLIQVTEQLKSQEQAK